MHCSWTSLSEAPPLNSNEVHVWKINVLRSSTAIEYLKSTLSRFELERATRLHWEHDRRRYVVAHGTLRKILGAYLQTPPEDLQFCRSAKGKPALSGEWAASGLRFNLSHSRDL